MLGYTTLTELSTCKTGGYTSITYRCSNCRKNISFPEQQGFNYCYLRGARIRKIKSASLTWNPLAEY